MLSYQLAEKCWGITSTPNITRASEGSQPFSALCVAMREIIIIRKARWVVTLELLMTPLSFSWRLLGEEGVEMKNDARVPKQTQRPLLVIPRCILKNMS